ncbi:MAG: DUF177 domain-containing protein [Allosphingosinicella sp.]
MNEFSRLYPLETLSEAPRRVEIEAGPDELQALARRFGLLALDSLTAEAELRRTGETVTAAGRLRARVTQSCVASAEPVEAEVAEDFQVDFRPLPAQGRSEEEEIELGEGELDVIFHEGEAIDLGEGVAQTLLLGLDPYPRSAAAEATLAEAGVKSEEEARIESSPFAALAALKGKLD